MKILKITLAILLFGCGTSITARPDKERAVDYLANHQNTILVAVYRTDFIQIDNKKPKYTIYCRVVQVIKGKALKINDLIKCDIYVEQGPGIPKKSMLQYDNAELNYVFFDDEFIEKSVINSPFVIRYMTNIFKSKEKNIKVKKSQKGKKETK